MNSLRRRSLFVLFAITAAVVYFTVAKQKQVVPKVPGAQLSSAPEHTNVEAAVAEQKGPLRQHRHIKERVEDMTEDEKARFEKEFAEKIKPAVRRFCDAYAGHISFRPEDVTMDKLRVVSNLRSDCHSYDFVIDGTTCGVIDDAGKVYVDSLMAPAARDLVNIPSNPSPPKDGSVSKEEILRLIKADSGKDFPPDWIAIIPTGRSSAMNGGVSVYVGEGANLPAPPLSKYAMVFGPDGNLVCYDCDP